MSNGATSGQIRYDLSRPLKRSPDKSFVSESLQSVNYQVKNANANYTHVKGGYTKHPIPGPDAVGGLHQSRADKKFAEIDSQVQQTSHILNKVKVKRDFEHKSANLEPDTP